MSRPCGASGCYRPIPDSSEALGCPFHQARIRRFTRDRLAHPSSADDYLGAVKQAVAEMNDAARWVA